MSKARIGEHRRERGGERRVLGARCWVLGDCPSPPYRVRGRLSPANGRGDCSGGGEERGGFWALGAGFWGVGEGFTAESVEGAEGRGGFWALGAGFWGVGEGFTAESAEGAEGRRNVLGLPFDRLRANGRGGCSGGGEERGGFWALGAGFWGDCPSPPYRVRGRLSPANGRGGCSGGGEERGGFWALGAGFWGVGVGEGFTAESAEGAEGRGMLVDFEGLPFDRLRVIVMCEGL